MTLSLRIFEVPTDLQRSGDVIAAELAVGVTGSIPDASTAVHDPIAEARELTGRKYLPPKDRRRRYELIGEALAVGGRKHSWLAEQIGCSTSNMSRLIKAAREALAPEGTAS
jgi:hypothetical protein